MEQYSGCVCEDVTGGDYHPNPEKEAGTLPSPAWVGLIQSMEDLNRTKRRSKRKLLPCVSGARTSFSPALDWIETSIGFSWVLSLASLGLDGSHRLSCRSSLPMAGLGLVSLHNHVSQIHTVTLSPFRCICVYTYWLLLCRILTLTGSCTGPDWGDELQSQAEAARPPNPASIKRGSVLCSLARTPPQKLPFLPQSISSKNIH